MNWFLMLWPMAAAASLTLALVHFWRWLGQRDERANLLFSVAATATASVALIEMMLARAESTAQYATLVRWCFAPLWVQLVSLILFVREYFGVGRRWLALSSLGLWTLTVIINFLPGQNLVYNAMTGLRPVEIGGATFVVGEGIANPWNAVNYLGTLLMLAFVVDASIALWRQGGRRKALVVGGGVTFFYLVAGVHSALIEAGLIQLPYVISFSFLAVICAMSVELNGDLWRAAAVQRKLQQSEAETLRLADFQPISYPSAEAFLADEKHPRFDCLLLDIRLGGMSGLDLFRQIAAQTTHTPVIFITAFDDPEMRAQAEALGCAGFFHKTTPGVEIIEAIRRATLLHAP